MNNLILSFTVFFVSVSLGLTIYDATQNDQWELYFTIGLFIVSYVLPFLNKSAHILFTCVLLSFLGRLSSHNTSTSLAALVLYNVAVFIGHFIGRL